MARLRDRENQNNRKLIKGKSNVNASVSGARTQQKKRYSLGDKKVMMIKTKKKKRGRLDTTCVQQVSYPSKQRGLLRPAGAVKAPFFVFSSFVCHLTCFV